MDLQEELMESMKEIKLLQNNIWRVKVSNVAMAGFSAQKFNECEILLTKCFDALGEIRRLEAVEQRYDPS
jgi:hypothetical protein